MKKCFYIFVTICLIICCINAKNENMFHSRDYLDDLNEGLESFPRFNPKWLEYSSGGSDNVFTAISNGFRFLESFFKNVLTYPFKVIIWVFKMIGIVLPSFVWWQ